MMQGIRKDIFPFYLYNVALKLSFFYFILIVTFTFILPNFVQCRMLSYSQNNKVNTVYIRVI